MNSISKSIGEIEDKYGLVIFRMALSHLMDVGISNFTDENVEAALRQIVVKDEESKSKNLVSIMGVDFQCNIVRCSAELSKYSVWDLFYYVKKHVHIDDR